MAVGRVWETICRVQNLFVSLCRALAASAPIWQFDGLVPCGTFFSIVTNDFKKSGPGCSESIQNSWNAINHLSSTGKTSPVLFQRTVMIRSVLWLSFHLGKSWDFWNSARSAENCLVNLALLLNAYFCYIRLPSGLVGCRIQVQTFLRSDKNRLKIRISVLIFLLTK